MQNKVIKMGVVAAMVMAGASAVHAADQPSVVISGDVSAVSCTISAKTGPVQNTLDLGNFAPADFSAGQGIYQNLFTTAAEKPLTVSLSGCTGTSVKDGVVGVNVNGLITNTSQNNHLFGGGAKDTSTTAGVTLAAPETLGGTDDLVKNTDFVPVYKYTSGEIDGSAADTKSVIFKTKLASTVKSPVSQHVEAPISFTIGYN